MYCVNPHDILEQSAPSIPSSAQKRHEGQPHITSTHLLTPFPHPTSRFSEHRCFVIAKRLQRLHSYVLISPQDDQQGPQRRPISVLRGDPRSALCAVLCPHLSTYRLLPVHNPITCYYQFQIPTKTWRNDLIFRQNKQFPVFIFRSPISRSGSLRLVLSTTKRNNYHLLLLYPLYHMIILPTTFASP